MIKKIVCGIVVYRRILRHFFSLSLFWWRNLFSSTLWWQFWWNIWKNRTNRYDNTFFLFTFFFQFFMPWLLPFFGVLLLTYNTYSNLINLLNVILQKITMNEKCLLPIIAKIEKENVPECPDRFLLKWKYLIRKFKDLLDTLYLFVLIVLIVCWQDATNSNSCTM